jgi:hypothetical protein
LNTRFAEADALGALELLSAEILTDEAQPEDYVMIDTSWAVTQPLSRDWSLFVHLLTPDDVIISQRDVYPAQVHIKPVICKV